MKLAIDCDGVIFDFVGSFMDYIERIGNPHKAKLYGTPISWNMWEWMGIEKDQFFTLLKNYARDGGFKSGSFMDLQVANQMRALSTKHDILIVTARHAHLDEHKNTIVDSTIQWLDFFNIAYHDLLFVRDKTLVNADIFLDDGPHNLDALHSANKMAICYDQPYNQMWAGHRVKNWKEFGDFVKIYE